MTHRLTLHSEPYPPSGAADAAGVIRNLGKPKMSLADLLLRETLQNSCDASTGDPAGVRYSLTLRNLATDERGVLAELLGRTPPSGLPLADALHEAHVPALTITDRGTKGLGGPTRADVVNNTGEPARFVRLVRNVGEPSLTEYSSGTYGYGKSVLFLVSRARTVLIHTRYRSSENELKSRLIGMALGDSYANDGRRYTGRHWWGVRDPEVGAEPVTGQKADDIATAVGLPVDGETGTTIMIIAPEIDTESAMKWVERAADTALLYAWPRIIGGVGVEPLTLEFRAGNERVAVKDPARDPRIRGFVEAMRIHEGKKKGNVSKIRCPSRPVRDLGRLALTTTRAFRPSADPEERGLWSDIFSSGVHHTAFMRHARLVIEYHKGPRHPAAETGVDWAGVFVVDGGTHAEEVDTAFANAEPPAHDEWNWQRLEARSQTRRMVRVGIEEIKASVKAFLDPGHDALVDPGPGTPLGILADDLADLISDMPGPGTGLDRDPSRPRGTRTKGPSKPRIRITRMHYEAQKGIDEHLLHVDFEVEHAAGEAATLVEGSVRFALDDGTPDTAGPPVEGWIDPDGDLHPGQSIRITDANGWTLVTRQERDVSLIVDIKAVS